MGAAVYVLSDPVRARDELQKDALRRDVPMPDWDLPPADFDHDATMEAADLVLLVATATRSRPSGSLAAQDPPRQLLSAPVWERPVGGERRPEFVYAATTCGLRKGFLDVLDVWSTISPNDATLHVVGRLSRLTRLLAEVNTGIVAHGWIDSDRDEYLALLRSCCFAYVPWVEGQMGTCSRPFTCVPVTTGRPVRRPVLAHGVVVEPRDPVGQRAAIDGVLSWPYAEYQRRQKAVVAAAKRHHNWNAFARQVSEALCSALEADGETLGAFRHG